MAKVAVARIYLDESVEYVPPSDFTHPPVEGELRVTLDGGEMHHLELFKRGQWTDLGEVTSQLLKEHGLDPLMQF